MTRHLQAEDAKPATKPGSLYSKPKSLSCRETLPHLSSAVEAIAWLHDSNDRYRNTVLHVSLNDLPNWKYDHNGNLAHSSSRFFSVRGMLTASSRFHSAPVIHQPETGILACAATEVAGQELLLVQAKWEPGNPANQHQLAPAIQATASNLNRAHRGSQVPLATSFEEPYEVSAHLSEQGWWFYDKHNRNVVKRFNAQEAAQLPIEPQTHRWVPTTNLICLAEYDLVLNMDLRSVLALHLAHQRSERQTNCVEAPSAGAMNPRFARLVDLPAALIDEDMSPPEISSFGPEEFIIFGVKVQASNREITRWDQPIFAPISRRLIILRTTQTDSGRMFLLTDQTEPGHSTRQYGPLISTCPQNANAHEDNTLIKVLYSEEGGRFQDATGVYTIAATHNTALPPGSRWVTLTEYARMITDAQCTVEARSTYLLAEALSRRPSPQSAARKEQP